MRPEDLKSGHRHFSTVFWHLIEVAKLCRNIANKNIISCSPTINTWIAKCHRAFTHAVRAECVKSLDDTCCTFPFLWRHAFVFPFYASFKGLRVRVPLVSRRERNVCFCVRLSACVSAGGVVSGARCVADACLFILPCVCVKMSGGINVTELAGV